MTYKVKYRYLVSFSTWFSLLAFYLMRGNISVAIISMNAKRVNPATNNASALDVNHTTTGSALLSSLNSSGITNGSKTCVYDFGKSSLTESGPFSWTPIEQGTVLSAFFYGYLSAHILGSMLSTLIGPRYVIIIGMVGATVFTFAIVPMSYLGYEAAVVARFFVGFFSGPVYPLTHEIIGAWAPVSERTVYAVTTHTGNIVGLLVNFSLGAFLCEYHVDGWKYFMYASGAVGVVNLIIWCIFVYDNPMKHPFISEEERDYIIKSLFPNGYNPQKRTLKSIPLRNLFTSKNVYLIGVAHFAYCFLLYAFLTGHAKFLAEAFGLEVLYASYFSLIPFICNFLFQIGISTVSNYLLAKKKVTVTQMRKINTFVGLVGSCSLLIPPLFMKCDQMPYTILLLSISMGFVGFLPAGFFIAMIDIAPKYAGYIMAIDNTIGSIAGIINPQIAGVLISKYGKRDGWGYLFIITAVASFILGMIWVIFGTCEKRMWAELKATKVKEKEEAAKPVNMPSASAEL